MGTRGARIGAAAVALGLSIAGPQAVDVANAESADPEPGPSGDSSAAASGPGATARTGERRSRRAMSAGAGRTSPGPSPAAGVAEAEFTGAGPAATAPTRQPRRNSTLTAHPDRPPRTARPDVVAPAPAAQPAGDPAPATVRHTRTTMPSAAASGEAPALSGPAAPVTTEESSAPSPPGSPPAAAPAPARPPAVLNSALGSVFDSAANWLSGLPASPVVEFLQGALLLVRRTVLGVIGAVGAVGANQTVQTATASPYLGEQELREHLLALAQQQYGSLFGQTVPDYGYYGYRWMDGGITPLGAGPDNSGPSSSDTNTQVDGVDEADFVETDGRYLYVARNGALTVLDTESGSAVQSALSGFVVGQYLHGDRLTVITQSGDYWYGPAARMAYGPWWDWNPQTTVTVFDMSDRTAPTVAGQTVFDGSYRDSRSVEGTVYLVLDRSLKVPEPLYTEVPATKTSPIGQTDPIAGGRPYPGPVSYRTYETWDAYVARVGDQITTLSLPHVYSVGDEGNLVDLGVIAEAGHIVRPESTSDSALLTVVSVDSAADAPGFASATGSLAGSSGTTVYMTPGALYLATVQDSFSDTGSSTSTRIERFLIEGAEVSWQAAGVVPGTLINQFAMDERDGYLRVAAYTWNSQWAGGTWATVNHSGVYVLDTTTLDVVGSVTGLAPGEQLYAARFVGDIAYLVTFLQTDPLFAIDLSDPTNPTLEGELVIPGFSNYLQSVGDGLLLGIGQEREPGSWNNRLHVSLFDVGDGANLSQIERHFLDQDGPWSAQWSAQWSWSQAQFDHHALLYTPEADGGGMLVVPVVSGGLDSDTGAYRYQTSLHVLRIGDGIETVGVIHTDDTVERTVRVGDVLYAVTDGRITGYSLTDLTEVGSIALNRLPEQPVGLLA